VALSQPTTNIRTDPKYTLQLSLSSVRRLYHSYMLALQANVSAE
jgi:hypothetical protein